MVGQRLMALAATTPAARRRFRRLLCSSPARAAAPQPVRRETPDDLAHVEELAVVIPTPT
jgi:hypothetical protein